MQIAQATGFSSRNQADSHPELVALFVFFAYYLGTQLGFALTFQPHPISAMWPPNAILLAALLLTPTRSWWLPIVAALPAHLLGELQSGVPSSMIAAWFVSNCSEALIGAAGIRALAGERFHFHSLRNVAVFVGCGVFLGPFASSFIDSAFVSIIGWGQKGYWDLWRARFGSNALAALTFVPVIVTWSEFRLEDIRRASFASHLEAAVLSTGLLLVALLLFNGDRFTGPNLALALAPVPFLIWAALRFGAAGASLAVLALALSAISGAAHGHGPFVLASPMESANAIQVFLTLLAIPLLALSGSLAERERSNRALAETEEELRLALSAARIGTWHWDIAERQGYLSDESRRIFGREWMKHDMTVDVFADLVHPGDRDEVRRAVRQALHDSSRYEVEFRVGTAGAAERWVMSKGEVMFDTARRAKTLFGVNVDVTDAKRAAGAARREAALLESESRFRELADSLPHVIWAARADGYVDYLNRRWYELTGTSVDAAGDSGWFPLLHVDDRAPCRRLWSEAIRQVLPFEMEYRLLCSTPSEYRWQKVRALPVLDPTGQVVRWNGTLTDIHDAKVAELALRESGEQTNRALRREIADHKKTEGALTHLTRVAMLGELTGALAHELNQPLTAILANAQATQRILAREPLNLVEVRESLREIVFEDKRASEVIRHLRSLLKKGEPQILTIAVDEIVAGALDLARSELTSRGVSCELRLDGGLPPMRGDQVQLEQVFLNLILNACEAMDGAASTRRALILETRLDDGATIHVRVADTGPGILPELLDGLFAPFYTTKEHGLGLGLSISSSIVRAHGGRIWAENAPGGGSVFHLTLPGVKETA